MPNSLSGSTGNGFQYLPPMGVGQPGSVQQSSGGIQQINFRDPLDAARSGMAGYVPSAAYPDGYLGTIQSRREDRLLDSLKSQENQRSYQRGVHKGERIDAADYFWPASLQPDRGLQAQARAVLTPDMTYACQRQRPLGTIGEQMIVSGGQELPTTPRGKIQPAPAQDVSNGSGLKKLAPNWQ